MTEPWKKMLNVDFSAANAKEMIDYACPLLEELRNYATGVYARCGNQANDIDMPVFVLFHHVIEMADGIHVLLSASCCEPALPLLRSLFEAFISMEFILASKDEAEYSLRTKSWIYMERRKDMKIYARFDPDPQNQTKVPEMVKQHLVNLGPLPDVKGIIQEMERNLKSGEMAEIAEEQTKRKASEWYQLFKGPNNRRELARRVGREDSYELLYTDWSRTAHGGNPSRYVIGRRGGKSVVRSLRSCKNLYHYAKLTCSFLMIAINLMIKRFRPAETVPLSGYVLWHDEMLQRCQALAGREVTEVPLSPECLKQQPAERDSD